ncbi:MAG: hypothetical protein INQ03_13380 [Candidatus Heimdallarchaeota archaeon]|nr:hypothetical protein [Candidatus Heimdallarchaeota archaeon]
MFPFFYSVTHMEKANIHVPVFNNNIQLFIIPSFLILLFEIVIPIIKFRRYSQHPLVKQAFRFMLASGIFISLFGLLISQNHHYIIFLIRFHLGSLGMLFWIRGLLYNPSMLAIPKAQPVKLFAVNNSGMTVYSHDFQKLILQGEDIVDDLISSLFSALNSFTAEVFDVDDEIVSYGMGTYIALIYKRKTAMFVLISTGDTQNLRIMLKSFALLSCESVEFSNFKIELTSIVDKIFKIPMIVHGKII